MERKQGELSREHVKKILDQSTTLLCGNLRPDSMLLTLLTEGAVKRDDVTKINRKDTNTEKVQALLDILAESPVSAYKSFMSSLLEERSDLHAEVLEIQKRECDVLTVQPMARPTVSDANIDLMRIANVFVNDKGQIQYKGRTIHYSTKGRFHNLSEPWVYDGTAWDVESGTSTKARHFEEPENAAKAAFEKLIVQLKQKGILKEQEEEASASGKDDDAYTKRSMDTSTSIVDGKRPKVDVSGPSTSHSGYLSPPFMDVEPDSDGHYTSIHVKAAKPSSSHFDFNENYNMMLPKKGLAYILNNSYFPKRHKKKFRLGSEEDFVNMKHLFTELGYPIEPHENLEAQEILQTMKAFVSKFSDTDLSAVVVLMSHGDAGYILGTDENKVKLKDIQAEFEGCLKLKGKPKLFFIQACRGNLITSSTTEADNIRDDTNPSEDMEVDADSDFPKDIPNNADMHFAYATPEGYLSLRNKTNGSWLIQAITEVFLAHAHEENLDNLMNKVAKRVTEQKGNLYDSQKGKTVIAQQTPQIVKQGMRKALYFLPKYPPMY